MDEFLYSKLEKKFAVVSGILDGAKNTIEVNQVLEKGKIGDVGKSSYNK